MIGYKELLQARIRGDEVSTVFVYVDAIPYRLIDGKPRKQFGTGVVIIYPDDDVSQSFTAMHGLIVHIIGGDEQRVKLFVDRIWKFNPLQIVANWGDAMEIIE